MKLLLGIIGIMFGITGMLWARLERDEEMKKEFEKGNFRVKMWSSIHFWKWMLAGSLVAISFWSLLK